MDFIERSFEDTDGCERSYKLRKPTREEYLKIADKAAFISLGDPSDSDCDFSKEFLLLCIEPTDTEARALLDEYPPLAFKIPSDVDEFDAYEIVIAEKTKKDVTFTITSTRDDEPYTYTIKCERLKNVGFLAIMNSTKLRATVLDKQARLHLHKETLSDAQKALVALPALGLKLGSELLSLARPKMLSDKKKL
jgi:hypothetical protein